MRNLEYEKAHITQVKEGNNANESNAKSIFLHCEIHYQVKTYG